MMEKAILLICREPDRAETIASELERGCATRVERVATVDDGGVLDGFALAVYWLDRPEDLDNLTHMLRTGSLSRSPVPVVALAERYDEGQALTCFRQGVTDYLSLNDHREVLPAVVRSLTTAAATGNPAAQGERRPARGGKPARPHPALKR